MARMFRAVQPERALGPQRQTHTLVDVTVPPHRQLPRPGSYKNHRPTEWWTTGGKCCACQKLAEREGYMLNTYEGCRDRKPVRNRHMPDTMPDHWTHVTGGGLVPKRRTACLECSRRLKKPVWLCPECHTNHLIWDHEMGMPAGYRVSVG